MSRRCFGPLSVIACFALALLFTCQQASAQWKIASEDGVSYIKVGFLAQGQAEWLEVPDSEAPDELENSQNLFFRRLRFLAGGQINDKMSFFFETDSPNLGKGKDGTKGASDMYVQDAFITYSFSDAFKIDGGMILIPNVYNAEQSAASLLTIDYSPFTFLASGPTDSRAGRDYGVQIRGYPLDKHLEYRLGVYQGKREEDADNDFRYVGRVVWHVLEPQTGFFYAGTTLGKKDILDIGASIDHQEEYNTYGFDIFSDQPIGNGNRLTFQVDHLYFDGDKTFPGLDDQNAWLGEVGFYSEKTRLGAFAQACIRDFEDSDFPDEEKYQAGLAYWVRGHNLNLKLAYGLITEEHEDDREQVLLQCQVFMY